MVSSTPRVSLRTGIVVVGVSGAALLVVGILGAVTPATVEAAVPTAQPVLIGTYLPNIGQPPALMPPSEPVGIGQALPVGVLPTLPPEPVSESTEPADGPRTLPDPVAGTGFTNGSRMAGGPSVATITRNIDLAKEGKIGDGRPFLNNCLYWASLVSGYHEANIYGYNPEDMWATHPKLQHADRTPAPGAVLLYAAGNGNQYHAIVYLGDGLAAGTDMDTEGNWDSNTFNIFPANSVDKNWNGQDRYLGWMSLS